MLASYGPYDVRGVDLNFLWVVGFMIGLPLVDLMSGLHRVGFVICVANDSHPLDLPARWTYWVFGSTGSLDLTTRWTYWLFGSTGS